MKSERQLTLFHSLTCLDECKNLPGRKVWLPDIPDNRVYVNHLLASASPSEGKVFIEDHLAVAGKEFPDLDICSFSMAKSGASSSAKVVLYPQSDTLSASVAKIYEALDPEHSFILTPRADNEGAGQYLKDHGLPFEPYSFKMLKQIRPDVFINLNDWTKETKRIQAHCHWLGIPVICLQESVIDFGDSIGRMKHADYAFVQGSVTYFNLDRELMFITGNPRYEGLGGQDPSPGKHAGGENQVGIKPVLINCNFTYDIHEDIRSQWLDAVTAQVEALGLEYQITRHPRDRSDLSRYKRSVSTRTGGVHEMIRSSSILVTRFSSLIHESLIMGVPVIYYNPHHESMRYDFEFNEAFLRIAYDEAELRATLAGMQEDDRDAEALQAYLTRHCLPGMATPSRIIVSLLSQSSRLTCSFSIKDFIFMILFLPALRRLYTPLLRIIIKPKS